MKLIGWVSTPIEARVGISCPLMAIVGCPISGADTGVAAARITSISRNSRPTAAWYQRRNRCARAYERPRHQRPGDQPVPHRRVEIPGPGPQPLKMQARPLHRR